jgi:phage protein D
MPVTTVLEESTQQGHFYVPQFEVKIAGVGLPRDVLRDVTQLIYEDGIKKIDSFTLTVNNWDADKRDFKYVGAETLEAMRYRLFEPRHKTVEVHMGYVGNLRLMMCGEFTTMEPNFPSSGPPTLTVRGLNVLHRLRPRQYTTTWTDKSDSEIAENIATLKDKNKKRFPLPIVTDPNAKAKEPQLPYVAQKNEYDLDFLLARARQRGYVVYVREGNPKGQGAECEPHLYFGPSDATHPARRDVTFKLKWGISLMDFKPTLTTANQISSVTFKGWNRNTRQPIHETVTLDDRRLNLNRDLHDIINASNPHGESVSPRGESVVDEPVYTPAQARERASAILMDRLKEVVKASGTCIGLPDLRAGQRVQIEGFGPRFSGTYFVTETTHTINDSGYTTRFNARRENREK